MPSAGRQALFSAVQQTRSAHLETQLGGSAGRNPGERAGPALSATLRPGPQYGGSRAAPNPRRFTLSTSPGSLRRPGPSRPPPARAPRRFTMLAGQPAAAEGLSAPPRHRPREEVPRESGVYSCRLVQRDLAEFSVGEAHQAAAVTAGPAYGSHFRRAEGQIAARCGGGRVLAERRNAWGPPKPRTVRAPEPRPCWRPRTPQHRCTPAAETCAGAASMRSADPPPPAWAALLRCPRTSLWRARGVRFLCARGTARVRSARGAESQTQPSIRLSELTQT